MSKVGAQALRNLRVPEPLPKHAVLVERAYEKIASGWYIGDLRSLHRYGFDTCVPSRTEPDEAWVSIVFSRDRMHHSVGWWRNADYEYCWHLSLALFDGTDARMALSGLKKWNELREYKVPQREENYWGRLFFGEHADKVWHEPGGTDPRLTPAEKLRRANMVHLRLFMDPETFEPFAPEGEVYQLTRWIPGLTPDKVDR